MELESCYVHRNNYIQLTFAGYVLFLEEDHYVAEDFLHVLNLLREEREKKKDVGDIICLGTYLKHAKAGADTNWVS